MPIEQQYRCIRCLTVNYAPYATHCIVYCSTCNMPKKFYKFFNYLM